MKTTYSNCRKTVSQWCCILLVIISCSQPKYATITGKVVKTNIPNGAFGRTQTWVRTDAGKLYHITDALVGVEG